MLAKTFVTEDLAHQTLASAISLQVSGIADLR
jgi:hypothetical protein